MSSAAPLPTRGASDHHLEVSIRSVTNPTLQSISPGQIAPNGANDADGTKSSPLLFDLPDLIREKLYFGKPRFERAHSYCRQVSLIDSIKIFETVIFQPDSSRLVVVSRVILYIIPRLPISRRCTAFRGGPLT